MEVLVTPNRAVGETGGFVNHQRLISWTANVQGWTMSHSKSSCRAGNVRLL
jgi:hypothetical protein